MANGRGGTFIIPPEFFGLSGLGRGLGEAGQTLREFGQQREAREQRDEQSEREDIRAFLDTVSTLAAQGVDVQPLIQRGIQRFGQGFLSPTRELEGVEGEPQEPVDVSLTPQAQVKRDVSELTGQVLGGEVDPASLTDAQKVVIGPQLGAPAGFTPSQLIDFTESRIRSAQLENRAQEIGIEVSEEELGELRRRHENARRVADLLPNGELLRAMTDAGVTPAFSSLKQAQQRARQLDITEFTATTEAAQGQQALTIREDQVRADIRQGDRRLDLLEKELDQQAEAAKRTLDNKEDKQKFTLLEDWIKDVSSATGVDPQTLFNFRTGGPLTENQRTRAENAVEAYNQVKANELAGRLREAQREGNPAFDVIENVWEAHEIGAVDRQFVKESLAFFMEQGLGVEVTQLPDEKAFWPDDQLRVNFEPSNAVIRGLEDVLGPAPTEETPTDTPAIDTQADVDSVREMIGASVEQFGVEEVRKRIEEGVDNKEDREFMFEQLRLFEGGTSESGEEEPGVEPSPEPTPEVEGTRNPFANMSIEELESRLEALTSQRDALRDLSLGAATDFGTPDFDLLKRRRQIAEIRDQAAQVQRELVRRRRGGQ